MSKIFRIKKIMSLENCKHIFINGVYATTNDILSLIEQVIKNNINFDIMQDNDTAYVNV